MAAKAYVRYCSNYNGCDITMVNADGTDLNEADGKKVEQCSDTIVEHAYEECNPHGEYYGDIDELEDFAKKTIHDAFGADVEVTFEEDNLST